MRRNVTFPKDVEDKLLEYRRAKKQVTGKLPFRETAIVELLEAALSGFVMPVPINEQIAALESRVAQLESRQCQ